MRSWRTLTGPLALVAVAAGLVALPVGPAAATEGSSTDYCMAIITGEEVWCASTESGLDEIREEVLGQGRGEGEVEPMATTHLVDLYDAAGRTGPFFALYGSPCDANADIDGSYTLPSAWNDRISSFQGFNQCETRLYEHGNFSGNTYGPVYATDNVGATMNDEASALRVY